MTPGQNLAFIQFSLASAITPGPNNAMLMASGANFGVRRTIPHMLGVALGYGFLVLSVGLGLGLLFQVAPILEDVIWALGTLYLLYLAWKIATADGVGGGAARSSPFTFLQAAAFQWINPKAWTGAIGTVGTFAPRDATYADLALLVGLSIATTIPAVLLWTAGGLGVRQLLDKPRLLRIFNIVMALLLALSLIPPALEHLSHLTFAESR